MNNDDPTIRRCISFTRAWGIGGIVVANLFALRATDPAALRTHYPVSPGLAADNDMEILSAARDRVVVAAWGAHGGLLGRDREVMTILKAHAIKPFCLGRTKAGHPRHPLYVPSGTPLEPFDMETR